MSLNPSFQHTTERLQVALTNGHFQNDLQSAGQKLLAHLRRPTQITVMGPKDAGKSSLIHMMLGAQDIALPRGVAISEVVFGTTPRVTFEGAGSGSTRHAGRVVEQDIPQGTVRIVQELPLEQLKGKALVEINLPTRPDQQKIILDWAIETTDIPIWCTQSFGPDEAALWNAIPDRLKDHGILALTKADRLQLQGALTAQTARFERDLAEEFLGMFPVATKQAIAARDGETVIETALWKNSGGEALLAGLKRQINSGKMADLDQADMLLAKAANTQNNARPTDATPKANPTEISARPKMASLSDDTVLNRALAVLDDCAKQMSHAAPDGTLDAKETLKMTLDAIQDLTSGLAQADETALERFRDAALESEQLILLLQLENTDTAASDALTALLQLKKDLAQEVHA